MRKRYLAALVLVITPLVGCAASPVNWDDVSTEPDQTDCVEGYACTIDPCLTGKHCLPEGE